MFPFLAHCAGRERPPNTPLSFGALDASLLGYSFCPIRDDIKTAFKKNFIFHTYPFPVFEL